MNISDVVFLSEPLETAPWVMQLLLITVAFVVLCRRAGTGTGRRKVFGRLLLESGVLLMVMTLGSLVIMALAGDMYIAFWSVFTGTVLAVYLRFFSEYRSTTKLVMWCSMYAGILSLIPISGSVSYLTGYYISRGLAEAIARPACYLLLTALAFYLVAFNFDEFEKIPAVGLSLIITGDVLLILNSVTESLWWVDDVNANKRIIFLNICFFIIVLLSIYVLYIICKEQEKAALLRENQQQLLNERERFAMAEQQIEEIRSIRHDLKNQCHYMRILLDEGRYEDLKHYFDQTQEQLPAPEPYVKCGNKSVNVILNMEFAKIGPKIKSRIKLEHLLVVPPMLPFGDEELCSVLTNLLDNAIDECNRMLGKGIEHPVIRFEIYPQSNFLYILCQNTTDRVKLDSWRSGIRSTKEDKKLHGYGTQIVAKIAEKYGGCAEYTLKDGNFVAKVLMDMMGEESDA